MTSYRPPAYVAVTAAAVLGALYFVPNASASPEHTTTTAAEVSTTTSTTASGGAGEQRLADTGSVDTTPYLIGGTAFLGMGAALVLNASRRARAY
ncbi:hypothetical protein ACIP98_04730 [Streptomyces sp. NPDC088354]|uniref:hypothetical protein n=1 Tax=unclassified Streptomyces TaxID=2593676 RepID=UPI0029A73F8F|nr:hypothetical protein [Streptomyces sp. MI02-7b]MDX3072007.1 hypothetical protein [Streptomyces sp. MI02-7b]